MGEYNLNVAYDSFRNIYNVLDKINLMSLIIYVQESDSVMYANLLYDKNNRIEILNDIVFNLKNSNYDIDIELDTYNKNVQEGLNLFLDKMLEDDRHGMNNYYLALHGKDEYAIKIAEISKTIGGGFVNDFSKLKQIFEEKGE